VPRSYKGNYTQSISRIWVGAQAVSPRSVFLYVTEGESRRATPPKLERRRVYKAIIKSDHNKETKDIDRKYAD